MSLSDHVWALARSPAGVGVVIGAVIYGVSVLGGAFVPRAEWVSQIIKAEFVCSSNDATDAKTRQNKLEAILSKPELTVPPLRAWKEERRSLAADCVQSLARQGTIRAALVDEGAVGFLEARRLLIEEHKYVADLSARERSLAFADRDTEAFVELGLVDILLTILALLALRWTGRSLLAAEDEVLARAWRRTMVPVVVVGFVVVATSLVLAGPLNDRMVWLGASSFVVSPLGWGSNLFAMLGIVVVFAQPVTLLWKMTGSDLVPAQQATEPLAPRGDSGVGAYLSFLHLWVMVVFVFCAIPLVLFVRRYSDIDLEGLRPYLLAVWAGLVISLVFVARIVRNALMVRSRYYRQLGALGGTWAEVEAKGPAPDPTIPLLGEDWWKLPATFAGLFATFWAFLEWAGASALLLRAFGG